MHIHIKRVCVCVHIQMQSYMYVYMCVYNNSCFPQFHPYYVFVTHFRYFHTNSMCILYVYILLIFCACLYGCVYTHTLKHLVETLVCWCVGLFTWY